MIMGRCKGDLGGVTVVSMRCHLGMMTVIEEV